MVLEFELEPLAIGAFLPSTAASIVVVGDTVSTFQVKDVGEELLLPTLSSALTLNVCFPSFIKL
jgi:hypothetical protein